MVRNAVFHIEMAHFERLAEFFGNNRSCQMSRIDAKWPETPFATSKWHILKDWQNSLATSSRFFENQASEICSHLSEKSSKGRFLEPEKLQNHSNEGKGMKKEKERGE